MRALGVDAVRINKKLVNDILVLTILGFLSGLPFFLTLCAKEEKRKVHSVRNAHNVYLLS